MTTATSTAWRSLEQNRPEEKSQEEPSPDERRRTGHRLPPEARAGLTRAWLAILRERHPDVTWIPADTDTSATVIALHLDDRQETTTARAA